MDLPLGRRPGFAVVDVETTGFDPELDRIVEVGVVVLDRCGREVGSFSTLVDPGRDPGPTHIHGISAAMVVGAPTFVSVQSALADLLSGRVLVGHNVDRFDLAFLRAECRRSGGEGLVPGPLPSVDTLRLAQVHLALAGRATLADCCTHYGLSWADHHSALGDARVTAALFGSVRAQLGDGPLGLDRALERARDTIWPRGSGALPGVQARADALAG